MKKKPKNQKVWQNLQIKNKPKDKSLYLDNEQRYPFKIYHNNKWVINESLLRNAISLANLRGERNIQKKASGKLKQLKKNKR